jgi:hypothetical protein
MTRTLISLCLALALSACAQVAEDHVVGQLKLRVPIDIPPHAATVRLQYGRITAFNAVQEQDPFCVFELNTVSDQAQPVTPARFDIVAIARSVESFSGMPVGQAFQPIHVAFSRDDGPSQIYYKTAFRLAANPQGARSLTCMSNQYVAGIVIMRHLTLAQMRGALGNLFSLELDAPL